jgi:putative tricarboxylic transport membrane protein
VTSSPSTDSPVSVRRSGRADVVSGLVVAGAGVLLLASALGIEDGTRPAPGLGPATLPTVLSTLLIVAGLALAVIGLRHRRATNIAADPTRTGEAGVGAGAGAAVEDELVAPAEPPVPWRRLAVVVALFIGYALIFIPLGYMLATAIYLAVMVTVIDRSRWKRNLIFAVVFAVVVYYGFTELLSVQLPAGVLG